MFVLKNVFFTLEKKKKKKKTDQSTISTAEVKESLASAALERLKDIFDLLWRGRNIRKAHLPQKRQKNTQ